MERKEWNKSNFFTESVSLRDILSYSDDDILNKVFCLYVDYETVVNNFDFFERVVIIMMIQLIGLYVMEWMVLWILVH